MLSCLCMMCVHNGDTICVKITTQYEQIRNVPDDGCQIGVIPDIPYLGLCLIHCSQNDDCLTVLHEGNTCSLYKSCERYHDKGPGQEIITKIEMKELCVSQ